MLPVPNLPSLQHPLRLVLSRYIKISLPYLAALLVAMVCTEVARRWMAHDSIPDTPELLQFLAHALLLHSVLGMDALSAGVWYVAIDFQLFTLFVAVLWLARSVAHGAARATAWAVMLMMAALALASLFFFNRDSDWDNWALYFMGAYTLGAITCWASLPGHHRAWRLAEWGGSLRPCRYAVLRNVGRARSADCELRRRPSGRGRLARCLARIWDSN